MEEATAIYKIPTQRDGVIIKTASELDDVALFLATRNYTHPLAPNKKGAPDYEAFTKLQKVRRRTEPSISNYGIWDLKRFEKIAFVGFVSLKRGTSAPIAEIGYEIVQRYRRYGYASLALTALMDHARDTENIEKFTTVIHPDNFASQNLVLSLGFELAQKQGGHYLFTRLASNE